MTADSELHGMTAAFQTAQTVTARRNGYKQIAAKIKTITTALSTAGIHSTCRKSQVSAFIK